MPLQSNSTILSSMFISGSSDFQQLMPDPSQHTVTQCAEAIFGPQNGRLYNLFVDELVNRIGRTIASQNKNWENPLAIFDKGNLPFGFSIQDVAFKFIRAHNYEDDATTLLKMHRPEARACYYTVDFMNKYPITINQAELEMAFVDEYGLNEFINGVLVPQIKSANYDVYNTTLQTLAEADSRWGLTKIHVDPIATKDDADNMLIEIKALAGEMQFPSCNFNANIVDDIAVHCMPSDCVILMTPRTKAQVDIMSLAQLFHLEKAEAESRIITVASLPKADWQFVVCDKEFFQVWDKKWETTSFYNPETLSTTYFLHVWKIIAPSPFANCVIGTSGEATDPGVVTVEPTAITLSCDATDNKIKSGEKTQLSIELTGTVDPDTTDIKLAPKSATYTITSAAALNSRTYIDRNAVLHTQKTLATGTELTITAVSTYINPTGETTPMTDTLTITIDNGDGEVSGGEGGGEGGGGGE